jgi:hypothetical protein
MDAAPAAFGGETCECSSLAIPDGREHFVVDANLPFVLADCENIGGDGVVHRSTPFDIRNDNGIRAQFADVASPGIGYLAAVNPAPLPIDLHHVAGRNPSPVTTGGVGQS